VSDESSPLFDAIRELVGSMRVNSHPISQSLKILKAIDAAEAAYSSTCDDVAMLNSCITGLRARVAELERRNHKLDMENMELEKEIRRLQAND